VQRTRKSGLPHYVGMRHDDHFVDLISSRSVGPRIRMIPLTEIDPNPHQARSELGNMKELMASIKKKGVLEPILVRPKEGRYEIIAGERRYVASQRIGLGEIPCIEMNVEDNEAMELALIENLQRRDLDVFEESDGLRSLIEIYGYKHDQIAEIIGKARSTITEIISVGKIPNDIRKICKQFGITSRSTLVEIAKQKDKDKMFKLLTEIKERELRREDTRELSKQIKGKTKGLGHFVYNYKPSSAEYYKLRIEFKRKSVSKDEIIKVLEEIIKRLKSK